VTLPVLPEELGIGCDKVAVATVEGEVGAVVLLHGRAAGEEQGAGTAGAGHRGGPVQAAQVAAQLLAVLRSEEAALLGAGQGSRCGAVGLEVLLEFAGLRERLRADGAKQALRSGALLRACSRRLRALRLALALAGGSRQHPRELQVPRGGQQQALVLGQQGGLREALATPLAEIQLHHFDQYLCRGQGASIRKGFCPAQSLGLVIQFQLRTKRINPCCHK